MIATLLFLLPAAGATPPECPPTPAALPPSTLFDPADPRLAADGVVVVLKDQRRAMVYRGGALAETASGPACWTVALASPYASGHKQRRGDRRTPEGWYRTSDRPWSSFSHALTVHYPAAADAARGLREGLVTRQEHDAIVAAAREGRSPPMETRLGGRILLHGGGGSADWTLGCIGFDDEDILALRSLIPADMRTDVLILP